VHTVRVIAPPWLDLLDETIGVCAEHQRADLADQLRTKRTQLLDPKLRVLVVGESNQGKSQLINALVNAPVCAVGDDLTTTAPTVVRHADTASAALIRVPAPRPGSHPGSVAPALLGAAAAERIPVPIEEINQRVQGRRGAARRGELITAEIGIPRQLLATGITLVDMPGLDSPHGRLDEATRSAALAAADTVLLATDASGELSATELDLLVEAAKSGPDIILAVTKIDLSARWREIAERNRVHLGNAGVPARVLPVSAALRLRAAETGDQKLNAESGFTELITVLRQDLAAKSDALARRGVAMVAGAAIAGLVGPLREELAAPSTQRAAASIARLQDAQRNLEELRKQAGHWQLVLADEVADLSGDLDYDLRERTRGILREVDAAFEEADPAPNWAEFEVWLAEELTGTAEANFSWLEDRFRWLVEKVAANFPMPAEETVPESITELPRTALAEVGDPAKPRMEPFTAGQKAFTALRSSYGGVLMFGLATSLAGLNLINPISLGAGVAFGGKGIRDEADSRLKRRQAVARQAAQRHIDDFYLRFAKDSKDALRYAQRRVRDWFAGLAERLQEDAVAAGNVARQAIQADAARREDRNRELQKELERLVALHRRAQALLAVAAAAPQRAVAMSGNLEISA
jgi:hypothetical protein